MVGTLEPRKGIAQVLSAFELLWADGVELQLVLVGKEGWRELPENQRRTIPALVKRLTAEPEAYIRAIDVEHQSTGS